MSREDALAALADTDWSGAEVDNTPRQVSVVHSVRLPSELSQLLEARAAERGLRTSAVLREIVEAALTAPADPDQVVTVRVGDLYKAIEGLVRRAA